MASGDLSNQVPIIPGGFVKDSLIGGMPGPLPDSQQRHWIPDERDNFISWLRGEFAAANAIIDTLCHHLQLIGKPGEYDFVLTCIQQRRYNWTVVLHMQQYFSVAEVVFALQQVVWLKQALNSDHSGLPPLFVSPENGGGQPWKDGPIIYRDPRGDSHIPGTLHHNSVPEEHLLRKETVDGPRKSEEKGERRRSESGDQARQQQSATSSSILDSSSYPNRSQADQAEQASAGMGTTRSDSSVSETSSVSIPRAPSHAQGISEAKEENVLDQGSHEKGDVEGSSSTKLEGSEGPSSERSSTPYFQISSKEEEDRRLASVTISKSHSCMEQIDGNMMSFPGRSDQDAYNRTYMTGYGQVNTVDGLELHEKVLDKMESSRLAGLIQEIRTSGKRGELGGSTFAGSRKGAKGKGRELLQFGHSHHHFLEDHKRRSSPKDELLPPVPAFLEAIIDRLIRWHIIPATKRPDCCSINIMEEGDYLPPHLDNSHLERPYYTIALQSECTLILGQSLTSGGPGDFKGPFQISLPVGSVLVLQRSSADIARHSVPASPSKRILITLGKFLPTKPSRGHNNTQTAAIIAQSPPRPGATPSSTSWGPSFNHNTNNRHGNSNNNNLQHGTSARAGAGGGFIAPFKSHKYTPVSSASTSGGVLPNPPARPPQPAQIISNVANPGPPLFTGTPGTPAGGAFPPPSLPIPTWSPLPRPPSRPPSAGTGVFFPSSGASSGPGRPVNMPPPRRSSNNNPSGPPLLQKTNSAPASFASLEAAAIAATAVASPSTPPGKSSKPTTSSTTTTSGSFEKVVPAARGLSPVGSAPQDPNLASEKAPSSDPQSDANGSKITSKEDNPVVVRSAGRSSKASAAGNSSKANAVNT